MRLLRVTVLICVVGLSLPNTVTAQEVETKPEKDEAVKPVPEPKVFVTSHSGRFGGERVAYTATASETYLRDKEAKPKAAIFSFAYTKF